MKISDAQKWKRINDWYVTAGRLTSGDAYGRAPMKLPSRSARVNRIRRLLGEVLFAEADKLLTEVSGG